MARNLDLWGAAYSTEGDVTATISIGTDIVAHGTVTTTNATSPTQNTALSKIASFALPDSYDNNAAELLISITVDEGTLWVVGFSEIGDDMHGGDTQLISDISYNHGDTYNFDTSSLPDGHTGQYHLNIESGSTVQFKYNLPAATDEI